MSQSESNNVLMPLRSTISLVLISFGTFLAIGPLVGILFVAIVFYNLDFEAVQAILSNPSTDSANRIPILIIQGFTSGLAFIAVPYFYYKRLKRNLITDLTKRLPGITQQILLSFLVVVCFMGVNAVVVDWNSNIDFPAFMDGFESWAKESESRAAVLTEFLINFETLFQFLLGFIVIAVIPGIGEEIVFRGIIQKQLSLNRFNPHLAIWLSAIFFSAFHLQFYGFVPRMLLGALFGYMYLWSGSITVPIIAHIVNNGFTLIMAYLYQIGSIDFNIQSEEFEFSLLPFLLSLSLFLIFIFYFRKLNQKEYTLNA